MGKIAKAAVKETVKPPDKPVKVEIDYDAIRKAIKASKPYLNARFDETKAKLQDEVNEMSFKVWIEPLVAVKFEKPVLFLFHEPFHASWVMEHYKSLIEQFTDCEINVVSEVNR